MFVVLDLNLVFLGGEVTLVNRVTESAIRDGNRNFRSTL